MNFVYFLLEITLIVLPFAVLHLLGKLDTIELKKWGKYTFLFFLFHNLLFFLGFSIKGDYFDYIIFALEYSFILSGLVIAKRLIINAWTAILNVFGIIIWGLGFVIALPGLFLFIVISNDYESQSKINYAGNGASYETRKFSYGFVTLGETKYTFDTYKKYGWLPIERLVDRSVLYELGSGFDPGDGDLTFNVIEKGGKEFLVLRSSTGKELLKPIN